MKGRIRKKREATKNHNRTSRNKSIFQEDCPRVCRQTICQVNTKKKDEIERAAITLFVFGWRMVLDVKEFRTSILAGLKRGEKKKKKNNVS